jgi:hypothetical protein
MPNYIPRKRASDPMTEPTRLPCPAVLPNDLEYYCVECKTEHRPTPEHPLCAFGPFLHKPQPPDIHFIYRGWKFTPPFICMCCGIEVCFRQWAFSRSCGSCDVSNSRTRRLLYRQCFAGPHELVDSKAEGFIPADHFIDPADREKYPVMHHEPRIPHPRPFPRPKPFNETRKK